MVAWIVPARSDQAAWDRALRPKLCKLACRPVLSRTVLIKLRQQWSPEQIAGWLKRTYPGELQNQVSHETIYRSLFIQARGVLKKQLLEHLRAKRTIRRSKHASLKRDGLGQIKNAVSIRERPASIEDRAVLGRAQTLVQTEKFRSPYSLQTLVREGVSNQRASPP